MIAVVLITIALAFLCGAVIGATIIRDALDGLFPWSWPWHKPKPPTIPLVSVVKMAEWKWLEQPTMKRRQAIPRIIDVEVR